LSLTGNNRANTTLQQPEENLLKIPLVAVALCMAASLLPKIAPAFSEAVSKDESAWTKLMDDGTMYKTLGIPEDSKTSFALAVEEAKRIDPDGPHTILSLEDLAQAQEKLGRIKEATASFEAATRIAKAMPGREGLVWQCNVLAPYAEFLKKQAQTAESKSLVNEQIAVDKATEKETADFAPCFTRMQFSIRKNWHPAQAVVSRVCSVDWWCDKNGDFYLVHTHLSSGDPAVDAAAISALRAVSGTIQLPPETIGTVAMRMDFTYNRRNKDGSKVPTPYSGSDDSVEDSVKNLRQFEEKVGPNSPNLIALLLSLDNSYERIGNNTDAEKVLLRAKDIYRKNRLDDKVVLCNINTLLGRVEGSLGKYDEAAEAFTLALHETENSTNPSVTSARAQALDEYSVLLYKLGKNREGREMHKQADSIR